MEANVMGMHMNASVIAAESLRNRPAVWNPAFAMPHEAQRMEAIGRFASGIVHDFNGILAAIVVYADMLVRQAHDMQQRQCAERMVAAVARGRSLVAQLLAYVRTESAGLEPTDICASTAGALDMLRGLAAPNVVLEANLDVAPLIAMADTTQVGQVVTNLCTNALHAMPQGGTLRVAVRSVDIPERRALSHGAIQRGRHALLEVQDDGGGMDKATLARAFEPFFTTRKNGRGTGLGLAIVKTLVERFGGGIDVSSAPGRGTRFSIYVPLVKTA
jgi:signal transduction histidine kinase